MATNQIPVTLTPTPEAIPAELAPILRGEKGIPGDGMPAGGTEGQVLAKASADDFDLEWVNQTGGGGTGATNLAYTASPAGGTVTSDTGTDATIPLADGTNAGLMTAAEKTKLSNTSGTNTGDQDLSGYSLTSHNHTGTYDPAGTAASAVAAHAGTGGTAHANAIASGAAGFMSGADKAKLDGIAAGATVAPVASVAGRTGTVTLTSADLTDTTAAGRALLDDADAAAQRTTLGLGDSATKNTGTTAGTVAAGDHAHSGYAGTGAIGSSGLTMATAKLLGRSTAATGAIEEITVGSGLSLSAGTLTASGGSGGEGARWIGAGELIPRVTTGAGIDGEELATNKINLDYLAFDAGTAEYAQASFSWPSGMATMTAKAYWTAASGSGAVVWGVQARCYADDDALDQAQGTAQTVTDTLLAASDTHISGATSAITPGGTVATGNLCVVQVYRDAASGSDTLAVDARLIGIRLEFAA